MTTIHHIDGNPRNNSVENLELVQRVCWYCAQCASAYPASYRLRPVRFAIGPEVFACAMHLARVVEHMAEVGGWVPVTRLPDA